MKDINIDLYNQWLASQSNNHQNQMEADKKKVEELLGITFPEPDKTPPIDIDEVDIRLKGKLPLDYKSFYKKYGNFNLPSSMKYNANFSQIQDGWTTWQEFSGFDNLNRLLQYTEEKYESQLIPSSFFVVDVEDFADNCRYFLLMGIDEDNHGKIFLWPERFLYDNDGSLSSPQWGGEPNTFMIPIANSFTEFLSILKDSDEIDNEFDNEAFHQELRLIFNIEN